MQGKEFKYYIIDENGLYLQSDLLGNVTASTTPVELKYAPKDWYNFKIKHKRTYTNLGIVKDFTFDLKFVKDGAYIMRYLFAVDGPETKAKFIIEQINHNTNTLDVYEEIARCGIDFSTYKSEDNYVFVNLVDSDIEAQIMAQYDTLYEWLMEDKVNNISDPDLKSFAIHDFNSYESSTFISAINSGDLDSPDRSSFIRLDLSQQSNNSGLPVVVQNPNHISANWATATSTLVTNNTWNWFFKNNLPITQFVKIECQITGILSTSVDFSTRPFEINIYDQTGTLVFNLVSQSFPVGSGSHPINGSFNGVLPIAAGAQWYLVAKFNGSFPTLAAWDVIIQPFNLSLMYAKATNNTMHKGYLVSDVFRKLIDKVSGSSGNSTIGDLIDFSDIATHPTYGKSAHILSSGQMMRNAGEKIYFKTSLKEFQRYIKTAYSMDIAVEADVNNAMTKRATCKYLDKLFDENNLIGTLTSVKDLRVDIAGEYMANEINVGWSQASENTATGLLEYNINNQYGIKNMRNNKKAELTSSYKTDLTTIEEWRNTASSTDSSNNDNDVCVVDCVENTGIPIIINEINQTANIDYILHRNTAAIMQGVFDNSVYNIYFSPKRCLLRNIRYVTAHLALYSSNDLRNLVLNNTSKTSELITTNYFAGEGIIDERADVNTQNYNPLLKPLILEINVAKHDYIVYTIYGNNYGYIEFMYKNRLFKGFIYDIDYFPDTRKSVDLKLIAHPSTNLLDFITL